MSKIVVVSGADAIRFKSIENHKHYCDLHRYEYMFDDRPYPTLQRPHFRKLESILHAMQQHECDWIYWLDDDAFFTDPAVPLETFISQASDDIFLSICKSPVNLSGGWTYLSAGQFFIRNTEFSRQFLEAVRDMDLETVRKWWDSEIYGLYTDGDQDCIVYKLITLQLVNRVLFFPYTAYNSRPYHYDRSISEHFLVHFAGVGDKQTAMDAFADKFDLTPSLLPNTES